MLDDTGAVGGVTICRLGYDTHREALTTAETPDMIGVV
jgi:hypothetical protein